MPFNFDDDGHSQATSFAIVAESDLSIRSYNVNTQWQWRHLINLSQMMAMLHGVHILPVCMLTREEAHAFLTKQAAGTPCLLCSGSYHCCMQHGDPQPQLQSALSSLTFCQRVSPAILVLVHMFISAGTVGMSVDWVHALSGRPCLFAPDAGCHQTKMLPKLK